jgi:hypothetical protein
MSKIQLILPFAGILAFGYFYQDFAAQDTARAEAVRRADKLKEADKLLAEAEARNKGIEEVRLLQERRKKERAEREARDAARNKARETVLDARARAFSEKERLGSLSKELTKEIAEKEKTLAALAAEKKNADDELAFLQKEIATVTENVREREALLERIETAEKNIAAAKAAAAARAAAAAKQ